jgi:hypothetical protein
MNYIIGKQYRLDTSDSDFWRGYQNLHNAIIVYEGPFNFRLIEKKHIEVWRIGHFNFLGDRPQDVKEISCRYAII